jgi:putative membrane protein
MPPFAPVRGSGRGFMIGRPGEFFAGHTLLGGLFVFLVLCVLVVIAAAAIAVLVRGARWRGPRPILAPRPRTEPPAGSDDALRILNERFARGEIEAAEYTERRDLLKQST